MEKICPRKYKLIIAIDFGKSEPVEKSFKFDGLVKSPNPITI